MVWLWILLILNQFLIHRLSNDKTVVVPTAAPTRTPTLTVAPTPTLEPLKSVLLEVPFTAQAPFGEWNDPRQQDGCEEAGVLMAMVWAGRAEGQSAQGALERNFAKEEILKMAQWQVENYGSFVDTNAEDTAKRLLGEYFGYTAYSVGRIADSEEIVRELMKGNLVIVPMNGRLLGNPNFTGLGPERHMVVVKGYDHQRKEFITNDQGTRQGRNYRYPVEVFFRAVRDYPTGDHVPITDEDEEVMIVVSR